jgi:hypothetical protein
MDKIRDFTIHADLNPDGFAQSLLHFLCVEDSRKKAQAKALDYLNRTYRQPFDNLVDRYAGTGPAEIQVKLLNEYVEAGVRHFVFRPACPPEEFATQLRRIVEAIIPRVRTPNLRYALGG